MRNSWDAATRRKRFRGYLGLLHQKIDAKEPSDFVFETSAKKDIPRFELEIVDVRPFIRSKKTARFDKACAAYKAVSFSGPVNMK